MSIITKLLHIYGIYRTMAYTGWDQLLHKKSPGKSRFRSTKQSIETRKIYANKQVEKYNDFLLLKNILLDFDLPESSESFIRKINGLMRAETEDALTEQLSQIHNAKREQTYTRHKTPYIYHRFASILPFVIWRSQNIYKICQTLNITPDQCKLIAPPTDNIKIHQLYRTMFQATDLTQITGKHLFDRLVITDGSFTRQITNETNQQFQKFALSKYEIQVPPLTKKIRRITLILRRDYYPAEESNRIKIVYRKIANEQFFIDMLRQYLPDIEICAVHLCKLSIKEQIKLITRTDILIGVHGAAFSLMTFLPRHAGIFEIIPLPAKQSGNFDTYYRTAVNRHLYYRRYIVWNPLTHKCSEVYRKLKRSGPANDLVVLPAQPIAKKIVSLVHLINKANA